MNSALLEVSIKSLNRSGGRLQATYRVTTRQPGAVYLVKLGAPLPRLSSDGKQLELWVGIPPQSELELSRFVNLLRLPSTSVLQLDSQVQNVSVELPIRQGGWWTEESERPVISLPSGANIDFVVVQGFGLTSLDPRKVTNIKALYEWQKIARSNPVSLVIP